MATSRRHLLQGALAAMIVPRAEVATGGTGQGGAPQRVGKKPPHPHGPPPPPTANFYVRPNGGTTAQCTGTTNADYPGSGTGQPCAYSNLQDAIAAATWGQTIALQAGQVFSTAVGFNLVNKGTPPTGSAADYITITTDTPANLPGALSGYPATGTRITTAMAAGMPRVRTTSANPVFWFKNSTKYWKLVGLDLTNQDTGVQCVRLLGDEDKTALTHYADHIWIERCWIHPIEEIGTALDAGNEARTAENAIYLEGTHVTIRQNAIQGFVGRNKYGAEVGNRMTSSALLIGSYADTVLLENNLLEAWTYALFVGGSGMGAQLVTQGGTVSNCVGNPCTQCDFSNTTGLSVGDPVAVFVSPSSSQNKWGAAFVAGISGATVTFVDPLCQSFDGGNSCTDQNGTPANGDAARWDGLQPIAVTVRQNRFAHYPEWATRLDGDCGGKGYLEIKACTDCHLVGNTFLGCSGSAITVRNQTGDFPWASLDGLTFESNYFQNSHNTFVGYFQDVVPTRKSAGITWANNLIVGLTFNVAGSGWAGGVLAGNFQGGDGVTITHNTVLWDKDAAPGASVDNYRDFICFLPNTTTGLTIQDNIWGVAANFCWNETQTQTVPITDCWPSATVDHNVLINTDGYAGVDINSWWLTPFPTNDVESTIAAVGFTSPAATLDATGNYRLTSGSAYHNAAHDGTDVGVNYPTLVAALGYDPNA